MKTKRTSRISIRLRFFFVVFIKVLVVLMFIFCSPSKFLSKIESMNHLKHKKSVRGQIFKNYEFMHLALISTLISFERSRFLTEMTIIVLLETFLIR